MSSKRQLEDNQDLKSKKQKKVHTCAICFGYLGTGYHGSQKQTGSSIPTVEGALEKALVEAGVLEDGAKWTRAARTDKGVHAVGNLVSVSMSEELSEDKIGQINENLKNSNLQIFFAKKVFSRFDARLQCDKRRYEYLLPKTIIPTNGDSSDISRETAFIEKMKEAFAEFNGTHNFHNYTSGVASTDPQAMRYILSTEISNVDGNFFKVVLVGQSFLFNQIRKLVASAIEYALARISLEDIRENLSPEFRKNLQMAPAEGLLLDRLYYDKYDEHKCNFRDLLPIGWALKETDQCIENFKSQVVYPEIFKKLPDVMANWISTLGKVFEEDLPWPDRD